jgi:hypothetical protein
MAMKKPAFPNRPCPKCQKPIHIKSKKHEECGWGMEGSAETQQKPEGNKSAAVREILDKNPNTPVTEIVSTLAAQGIQVSGNYVYMLKSKLKAKKQKAKPQQAMAVSNSTANGENVSGYFKPILMENPKLLKGKSNQELLNRWLADHPDETEVPNRIKAILSNLKSVLRKKLRKKPGRKKTEEQVVETLVVLEPAEPVEAAEVALESLEEQIDDCLSFAKNLDREGLDDVISLLRRARNAVVWKLGQ